MEKGIKYDGQKIRWDLLPFECLEGIVKVLMLGSKKYSDNNWKKVDNATERYFAALMRHIVAWRTGCKNDSESGLNHLYHAACCVLFLLWFDEFKK
jgi:hypothetical protein